VTRAAPLFATTLLAMGLGACGGDPLAPAPFVADVISFSPGSGAGFGQDELPDIVLGAPRGGGQFRGSLDVLSLGVGGEIVLELGEDVVDRPGTDLIVFENAFSFGGGLTFIEPGAVAFSQDGIAFLEVPCASNEPYTGCAGLTPVKANADDNAVDATDPALAGGDDFDLADVGLTRARYVRIRDLGLGLGPASPDSDGFDLDAISVVHGAE